MAKSAVTSNRDELFQFAIMGKKGVRAMNNITPETPANIYAFFILTFLLSLPFYVFAFLVPPEMALLAGLTLTLAPVSAALILVFRQNRSSGAMVLLKRAFDYKRIPKARWFIPILLLWPVIFRSRFDCCCHTDHHHYCCTLMGRKHISPLRIQQFKKGG